MMTKGRVCQNCKLNYPRSRCSWAGSWSYSEHAVFLLLFLSTLGHGLDKLSIKQLWTIKEGSTKVVNFVTIKVLCLINKSYTLSPTLSIYITLIAIIVLRESNAVFLCHCWILFILWWGSWYATIDFYLVYDGAADLHIWALLTRIQCRVSNTQVTFKALVPLVSKCYNTGNTCKQIWKYISLTSIWPICLRCFYMKIRFIWMRLFY